MAKRKLLVVEDDPGLQKQLRWGFDSFEVIVAGERETALAQLRRHRPAVVTLDLGLPPDPDGASEGLATLQQILTIAPDTKIIILSGNAWRGYAFEASAKHEANKITLYAETGGVVVGTMSLCLDRDTRLPADENFSDKLDELRAQGRRLCEPSRLAIDKDVTKRVFASLIHVSYIYAHNIHGFTDYVIEVNPRHVMFYKRMLGFSDFGEERACTRVGAPAVLLRLPLDHMGEQIRIWGGLMEQHGEERSFYPYFFPSWDEPGITSRLIGGRN